VVSIQYIEKIASLSKLNLSESEKETLMKHTENILDYVEILNEVDIDNEVLVNNIESKAETLRNDEVVTSFDREILLKNAPDIENGYFVVPNILRT